MKKNLVLLSVVAALAGCARFSTTQTDLSYDTTGKPQRTVTTRATAFTFFSANSKLAQWKATQNDHSQGATVGQLEQQSSDTVTTNLVNAIGIGVGAAVKALVKP